MNCDGYKVEGITYPSSAVQLELMRSLYKSKGIDPKDVAFVEMHGTGTPVGDINECESVADFFCTNRKESLPIGAVKSNMGHSETSSGLCSLTKVLIAMETGIIPANLHSENLDYTLPGLSTGKLQVVTKNLPWNGGIVSINCFGFGGANAHIILKSNEQAKRKRNRMSYRLVQISGRTEESVKYYLEGIKKHQDDQEFLALVDEIHKIDVEGHLYRGYSVLGDNPISEVKRITRKKRPIFFIYSGMGSQWTGMGKDLMKIDIFKNTIKRCANVLKPYNLDLEHILTSDDPETFQDIVNCFVAITATEIAMTDVLKAFDIEPDGFAGHSLGEVGCAYCNGDLTPEQAMLLGYARGYGTIRSNNPPGAMAAVGLGKNEISKLLPKDVYIACINGSNSVTITGLKEAVQKCVALLNEKGIFARKVETGGYAFHSIYIDNAAPHLREFAKKVLTDPKPRSKKWISSSLKESRWNNPNEQLNSADYHYNNFRYEVLFDQVLKRIPKDAIIIEVGPHGLLTSILKRELGNEATYLSLANKNSKDNLQFLLSNIGLLYANGGQPNLRKFYPDVKWPVGRGTPSIGSLVKWDHSIKWYTPFFEHRSFGKKVIVNTNANEYSFMRGHKIDGRVLMAATGYLELVWIVFSETTAKNVKQLPVTFESVKFIRATILPDGEDVVFYVNIMKHSGYFEIFEGGSVCCSGTVRVPKKIGEEFLNADVPKVSHNGTKPLLEQDIYKWFHLKRYMYSGLFQGLRMVDVTGTTGVLKWNDNFTTFLDTMIQVSLVPEYSTELLLPTRLQKLVIDPVEHLKEVSLQNNNEIAVYHDKDLKLIKSGGIEIINLEVFVAPKRQNLQADPVLETQTFVPYRTKNSPEAINIELTLRMALQIIMENAGSIRILNAYEIVKNKENSLMNIVNAISKTEPLLNLDFVDLNTQKLDIIFCSDGYYENSVTDKLNKDGFILICGFENDCMDLGLPIVYENSSQGRGIYLLRNVSSDKSYTFTEVYKSDFAWLDNLNKSIKNPSHVNFVINRDDDCSGIVGLVKCLNMELTDGNSVKCIMMKDKPQGDFLEDNTTKKQLSHQLAVNVLHKGVWGSYRHIPVNSVSEIEVSSACNYIQTIGDLSSFKWVERPPIYYQTSPTSEYAYVYYSALNFKDVMVVSGKLSSGNVHNDISGPGILAGFEFSGLSQSGKRVMGISNSTLSLQTSCDPLFTWEVPKSWSLEDAATVPVVYVTCYYGLIMRAQMKQGESILIHAGAGGIGIAAISIASSMDCEIYTTVGSQEKKEFLMKMFPLLKSENIGYSRNTSFEQMIMRNTKGRGVDLVLNSLSADMFQASIRCVAQRGRFVEIGKVDLWAGTPISASLFAKNTSFHGVLLDDIIEDVSDNPVKLEINRIVSKGLSKGVLRPLPRTVFAEDQVEDAYRFLSTGKHKGKVLIKIRNEDTTEAPQRTIKALPRIYFNPEKVYVLVGGLGGFGLELTNFLIRRCARKIILNSRRGLSNGYQALCLNKWSKLPGVTVKINTDDTSTLEGAQSLIAFSERLGRVGGIFNMALTLEDSLFANQTPEKFIAVFKSKIYSGLNLDRISRNRCPKLDQFIVFSSIACGRGNRGQSNYGMANSAMERLCEKRRQDGLPGLAVQYGPIGDVGAVAERLNVEKTVNLFGLDFQTITSCINALETFMLQPYPVGSTFVLNEESTSTSSNKTPVESVAHILGIKDITLIDKNQPLSEMGLDSLMSTEIKQTLYRNYNIDIAVEDIRELTLKKIQDLSENSGSDQTTPISKEIPMGNGVNGHNLAPINAMLSEEIVVEIINDKSYTKKIFFIPPIEGSIEVMIPLAQQLEANIYGLQCTKDANFDNIKDFAKYFVKVIRNIQSKGPYILCGYSYGGATGFEISVQLENLKEKVKLFLIDGTPTYVKRILEKRYKQAKEMEAKTNVASLKAFMESFDGIHQEMVENIVDESMDLSEQVSRVGDFVSKNTSYNSADVSVSADRYVKRITAGFFYEPTDVFTGDITLVRSNDTFKELSDDYDIQKICQKKVNLQILKGSHRQMLLGQNLQQIATLFNKLL